MSNLPSGTPKMDDADVAAAPTGARDLVGIVLELGKARLTALVVVTSVVGFLLAAGPNAWTPLLVWTALGTALTAGGANTLNQWLEADRDRLMPRTRQRPLPSGRITPGGALAIGITSGLLGIATLALFANWLTAVLGLANLLLYVLVYTPLKVRTPLNTLVGAVCGAIPPMMGWTAATGRIETGAWILGGLLLLWQIPHFLALAWLYREDYRRGGFRMLPEADPSGALPARLAVVYSGALLPLCALAWAAGLSGVAFLVASQLLGATLIAAAWSLLRQRSDGNARRLFLATLIYLPLVLGIMVADHERSKPASTGHGAPAAELALPSTANDAAAG